MSGFGFNLNDKLLAAKKKLLAQTIQWDGVEGCGTDGERLRLYLSNESIRGRIPKQVDGFEVVIVPSGTIHAHAI